MSVFMFRPIKQFEEVPREIVVSVMYSRHKPVMSVNVFHTYSRGGFDDFH